LNQLSNAIVLALKGARGRFPLKCKSGTIWANCRKPRKLSGKFS
jgi:hypothetical protein